MTSAVDLEPFLQAVLSENQHVNLTAIRDPAQARVLHVLDSLEVRALDLSPRRCLDLGSGNGFPGIALRLLYPTAKLMLLDRTRKKLHAVERALLAASIGGVETVHVDASQAPRTHPELLGAFDLITARAVGIPPVVANLAAPLSADDGRLVLWLDGDKPAPTKLPGYVFIREHQYDLPEPAHRHRRLGLYRLAHRTGSSRS